MGSEEPSLRGIADMRKRCMSAPPGEFPPSATPSPERLIFPFIIYHSEYNFFSAPFFVLERCTTNLGSVHSPPSGIPEGGSLLKTAVQPERHSRIREESGAHEIL
jgi:hypothetical protein